MLKRPFGKKAPSFAYRHCVSDDPPRPRIRDFADKKLDDGSRSLTLSTPTVRAILQIPLTSYLGPWHRAIGIGGSVNDCYLPHRCIAPRSTPCLYSSADPPDLKLFVSIHWPNAPFDNADVFDMGDTPSTALTPDVADCAFQLCDAISCHPRRVLAGRNAESISTKDQGAPSLKASVFDCLTRIAIKRWPS